MKPTWRLTILLLLMSSSIKAQSTVAQNLSDINHNHRINSPSVSYYQAFLEISNMLDGKTELSLKRAVFLLEWAYLKGKLDYDKYCAEISFMSENVRSLMAINGLDKRSIGGNIALFEFMTKPNQFNGYKEYVYDFEDFTGKLDHSKKFVTKLMRTHSGQCRSLPLLYKILANEIGIEAFIAYAPNHSFIMHKSENRSRYICVELTNHSMPREQFIIENMGITQTAIRTGTYMKPCNDREIILDLLAELTLGYVRLYDWDDFVKLCYETVLKHSVVL